MLSPLQLVHTLYHSLEFASYSLFPTGHQARPPVEGRSAYRLRVNAFPHPPAKDSKLCQPKHRIPPPLVQLCETLHHSSPKRAIAAEHARGCCQSSPAACLAFGGSSCRRTCRVCGHKHPPSPWPSKIDMEICQLTTAAQSSPGLRPRAASLLPRPRTRMYPRHAQENLASALSRLFAFDSSATLTPTASARARRSWSRPARSAPGQLQAPAAARRRAPAAGSDKCPAIPPSPARWLANDAGC